MISRFYVGVVGPEQPIKEFADRIAMEGATTSQKKGAHRETWMWQTAHREFKPGSFADELLAFLNESWNGLSIAIEYADVLRVTVQIVSERSGNDDAPHGYFVSVEAIRLLGQLDAALDIDVIWYGD